MRIMLVSAFVALFAFPAVAGEMPEATPAPAAGSVATSAEAAATVATGEVGNTGKKSLHKSMPSYSGYGGGCDRGHTSTEAMLIN